MRDSEFFGRHLKLSVRGASHAPSMSFALENFPAGFAVDPKALTAFMERRAPGRDTYSTQRREDDAVAFVSGLADGVTTGGTIRGAIQNRDMRPSDYGSERTIPRPGHADFGQWVEMGRIPTGGGKNSGRMTAPLCAVGGICKQWLERRGIFVMAELERVGGKAGEKTMLAEIEKARKAGDSVGGTITCCVTGLPAGLGGAIFSGLESELSAAIFGIPGVKGVAFGNGFEAAELSGSQNNDPFVVENGLVRTAGNRHGGILGGRTSGMPISFRVAMKPTPTVYMEQSSVDLATMKPAKLAMKGRHDPCIVRRALPVVEAMAAFVLADRILADEAAHPRICLTLTGKTLKEDWAQYESQRYFADMVELRVDLLERAEWARVATFLKRFDVPVVVTLRNTADGGAFEEDGCERARFFRRVLLDCSLGQGGGTRLYFDFEEDFLHVGLEALALKKGVGIVRSLHAMDGKPKQLVRRLRELKGGRNAIPKIAFMPRSLREVAAAFDELQHFGEFPYVVCAMGPLGLATRTLSGRLGSAWTYASVGGLEGIGHVSPHELVRTYRFRSVSRAATIYGVTGWPLKATRSPELNNLAFSDADEDAVMVPFPSKTAGEAVAFMRAMGMKGMAVTIPHKQTVMPLLDKIDKTAKAIGAVNTVVNQSGKLVGYNTDAEGFGEAIRRFVGREDFKGLKVAVLGAGGASKAVVYALKKLRAKVTVFHRRPLSMGYGLIVNATPVDPIPEYAFSGKELVYDLVYAPAETPLMARARAAGCRVENGLSMLEAQAAEQRRLYREGHG